MRREDVLPFLAMAENVVRDLSERSMSWRHSGSLSQARLWIGSGNSCSRDNKPRALVLKAVAESATSTS
jgi:hypothetical protein